MLDVLDQMGRKARAARRRVRRAKRRIYDRYDPLPRIIGYAALAVLAGMTIALAVYAVQAPHGF